jgi:hypothetical protein
MRAKHHLAAGWQGNRTCTRSSSAAREGAQTGAGQ